MKQLQRGLDIDINFPIALLDSVNQPVCISDHKFIIQYSNLAFAQLFQNKQEEITGLPLSRLKGKKYIITEIENAIRKELQKEKIVFTDDLFFQTRKNLYPYQIQTSPLYDSTGHTTGVLCYLMKGTKNAANISPENIDRFQFIFKNAGCGIVTSDAFGILQSANPAFCRLLGFSNEELRGITFTEITHPKHHSFEFEQLNRIKNGEINKYCIEKECYSKSGKMLFLHVEVAANKDKSGEIIGFIGTVTDITDNKLVENELKSNEEKLKKLNATKDKLLAIIGHDLKGPLNNISGFSQLIAKNFEYYTSDKIKKYNSLIYQSSQIVSQLLDNLLTWSCAQSDTIVYEPASIKLNTCVENCFELLLPFAERKQINLTSLIPEKTKVFADEEMITTVLRNLISNAIKYTYKGGKVVVRCSTENGKVVTEIEDDGKGIETEKIQELFEPNKNKSENGTDGEKGTGLGLLICKEFIERNKGSIWVESKSGEGTTFHFCLPQKECKKSLCR